MQISLIGCGPTLLAPRIPSRGKMAEAWNYMEYMEVYFQCPSRLHGVLLKAKSSFVFSRQRSSFGSSKLRAAVPNTIWRYSVTARTDDRVRLKSLSRWKWNSKLRRPKRSQYYEKTGFRTKGLGPMCTMIKRRRSSHYHVQFICKLFQWFRQIIVNIQFRNFCLSDWYLET